MRGTILVVDDDPEVREVLRLFFEGLRFKVIEAIDGTFVVPLIQEHSPDLVLCDLVMPGISGIYVLRQVRDRFPHQRVVVMSGIQEANITKEALELGALEFLTKPLSLERLEKELINRLFPPVI